MKAHDTKRDTAQKGGWGWGPEVGVESGKRRTEKQKLQQVKTREGRRGVKAQNPEGAAY